jgi:hypothetical protein
MPKTLKRAGRHRFPRKQSTDHAVNHAEPAKITIIQARLVS